MIVTFDTKGETTLEHRGAKLSVESLLPYLRCSTKRRCGICLGNAFLAQSKVRQNDMPL